MLRKGFINNLMSHDGSWSAVVISFNVTSIASLVKKVFDVEEWRIENNPIIKSQISLERLTVKMNLRFKLLMLAQHMRNNWRFDSDRFKKGQTFEGYEKLQNCENISIELSGKEVLIAMVNIRFAHNSGVTYSSRTREHEEKKMRQKYLQNKYFPNEIFSIAQSFRALLENYSDVVDSCLFIFRFFVEQENESKGTSFMTTRTGEKKNVLCI